MLYRYTTYVVFKTTFFCYPMESYCKLLHDDCRLRSPKETFHAVKTDGVNED